MPVSKHVVPLVFCAAVLATSGIYLRGADGPYVLDDYPDLVWNPAVHVQNLSPSTLGAAARSFPDSPTGRPAAMLSFAFNYYLAGGEGPRALKITNIFLHLACGVGLYLLGLLVLPGLLVPGRDPPWTRGVIAAAAAALWLLHPLFVSTVLYTIQRMTILSALFVVGGCVSHLSLRQRIARAGRGYLLLPGSALVFTILATLCKENGALLPVFLLIIEIFCFGFRLPPGVPILFRRLFKLLLIAPLAGILLFLLYQFRVAGSGAGQHDHQVFLHLVTEARAMWQYAGWLLFLNPQPLGLAHGDFPPSASLFSPFSGAVSVLAWMTVIGACVALRHRQSARIYLFGVAWFLGGHLLESTTILLSPLFEHRNYLPGFGLLLAGGGLGTRTVARLGSRRLFGAILMAYFFAALPAWLLWQRVGQWRSEGSLAISLVSAHPGAPGTWVRLAQFYNHQGKFQEALDALHHARDLQPGELSHRFSEAALRCHFEPGRPIPGDLGAVLASADFSHPTSRAMTWAARTFVEACGTSPPNRQLVRDVLKRAGNAGH